MAKRILGGLLVGALLWTAGGFAGEGVAVPPAEDQVAVLEDAFAQVTSFFRDFILEIRGSLTMLGKRVEELEKATLVLRLGVEGLAERSRVHAGQLTELTDRLTAVERTIERAIGPKIMDLDARVTALESHDFASLERRIGALDKTYAALTIRIDHNRAKVEGVETALAAVSAATEERLAAVAEMQAEAATQRQEIETLRSELAGLAQAQQAQWAAIFLVPLAVGGLLFLLLTAGS